MSNNEKIFLTIGSGQKAHDLHPNKNPKNLACDVFLGKNEKYKWESKKGGVERRL